jgi:hypothetical protein
MRAIWLQILPSITRIASQQTGPVALMWLHVLCSELNCPFSQALSGPSSSNQKIKPSVALVHEQTTPTERPPLVAEVSAKFADRWCHMVSAMLYFRFSTPKKLYFFQAAPQLYLLGWVDPVPDILLLRKSGSSGNRTRNLWICSQGLWSLNHRGGQRLEPTGF